MSLPDVQVYVSGLMTCSVCAPAEMAQAEVESAVNVMHPTGIPAQWQKSSDPTFKGGEPNPCACNSDPDRRHWLMEC